MPQVRISVSLRALRLPFRRALAAAQKLGVRAVELEAQGDLAPTNLSQTGRREVRHLLRSHDLELSSLTCPLRHGLDVIDKQDARIDWVAQAMTLAFDLGPRLVLVQAGKLPEKPDDPQAAPMRHAIEALARHGDRMGARLALEGGTESAETLAAFLDSFDTGSLAAVYNPANLMLNGYAPLEAMRTLRQRIAFVQAQDARRISPNRSATVPLGHGDLDWLALLGGLEEVEYRGALNVSGDNAAEVQGGVQFLNRV